jgi:hypothetical protein
MPPFRAKSSCCSSTRSVSDRIRALLRGRPGHRSDLVTSSHALPSSQQRGQRSSNPCTSGDSSAAAASAHPLVFHKAAPRAPCRRHAGCTPRARGQRGLSHRRYGPDPRAPPARSASHNASTPLVPSAHRGHSAPAASYGGSRTATADAPSRAHLSGLETTGRETSRAEGCRGWFLAGPPPPRCSGR